MSEELQVEDFIEFFQAKEFKKVDLKTMSAYAKNTIYLRGLTYAEVCRFRDIAQHVQKKKAVSMLAGDDDFDQWDDDLNNIEDYLIKQAVCTIKGEPFFTDDSYKKFKTKISPDVVNEILAHIKLMNELYGEFEGIDDVIESYKKKLDA
jgi:hypothetical protein